MREWMKEWGQFVILLVALGGFYGFIRSDMHAMRNSLTAHVDDVEDRLTAHVDDVEDRLTARIDRVEDRLTVGIDRVEHRLTVRIDRVETVVTENAKAVARLEGLVRGLHGLDLPEGDG